MSLPKKQNETTQTDFREEGSIKEEQISYEIEGEKYDGYVYYNEDQKGKRPGILVVHEWWD